MFRKYREIFYGIAFGILVLLIDTGLDAAVEGNSLTEELGTHPGMDLYRLGFIALGAIFGWLVWRNNRSEREARSIAENLDRLRRQCSAQALLVASTLQLLLTRSDLQLSDNVEKLLQEAYRRSQELQHMAENTHPVSEPPVPAVTS